LKRIVHKADLVLKRIVYSLNVVLKRIVDSADVILDGLKCVAHNFVQIRGLTRTKAKDLNKGSFQILFDAILDSIVDNVFEGFLKPRGYTCDVRMYINSMKKC
jgi:hypothetical protein